MKRRAIAAILALLASGVTAQTSITPSGGGGSSTITSGSTATSGCVAGGVLRSISNLVECGAGLTYTSAAGLRAGDSTLGSTVVPLTARLGTGSTANVLEMQNSAGTVLAKFDSGGMLTSGATTNQRVSIGMLSSGYSEGLWIGNGAETPSASNYAINRVNSSPGLYINDSSSTGVYFRIGNTDVGGFTTSQLYALGTFALGSASDVILSRTAAGSLQLGNTITSGSAINQTFRSHNATTGTDISGGNLTITAPGGTGSSTGGTIAFQTAPVLTSGTTAQTPVDRLTIAKDGGVGIGMTPYANIPLSVKANSTTAVGIAVQESSSTKQFELGVFSGQGFLQSYDRVGAALFPYYTAASTYAILTGGTTPGTYTRLAIDANGATTIGGTSISGTTVAATINNGTSTGAIMKLQNNGSDVFSFNDPDTALTTFGPNWSINPNTGAVVMSGSLTLNTNGAIATGNGVGINFSNSGAYIANVTATTPDSVASLTGATSNSWHFNEVADFNYDFENGPCGTSACTDPAFIIHSAAQDTTQYNATAAWGSAGGAVKALTESAATAVIRIPVPTNGRASGVIQYEIYATDGTDMQVRTSSIRYSMTNKAGTEACSLTTMGGVTATNETDDGNAASITAGTLTYAVACTNNAADTMDITFNAVSSLTQTTLQSTYSLKHLSPGQPLRQ